MHLVFPTDNFVGSLIIYFIDIMSSIAIMDCVYVLQSYRISNVLAQDQGW